MSAADVETAGQKEAARARRLRWAMALLALPLALGAAYGGDRAYFTDKVLRGVTVEGVSLSGMTRDEAALTVRDIADRLGSTRDAVSVAGKTFAVKPDEVSLSIDVDATVEQAFSTGRAGGALGDAFSWAGRLLAPAPVPFVATLDRAKLDELVLAWDRAAVDAPPFEGGVAVKEGTVVPDYPRPGKDIDREGAARAVLDTMRSDTRAPALLPLEEVPPRRARPAVDAAVEEARGLLSGPVVLEATAAPPGAPAPEEVEKGTLVLTLSPEKDRLVRAPPAAPAPPPALDSHVRVAFTPEDLAAALRSDPAPGDDRPRLSFDPGAIDDKLRAARAALETPPEDAHITINAKDEVKLVPGRLGTRVLADAAAAALLEAARSGARTGMLPVAESVAPAFTTGDAEALGVRGLVSKFTTYHACCQPRVKNIHRIADLIDGKIVRPGEVFSVNAAVGERTLEAGFVMAPSIGDGEMVDTIGGGVSQFATTMFNAIFYGAYDVVERQAHSYYFSRYPMGHEATLSFPHPDLVFRNDTTAAVVLRAEYTEKSITVKLYGDNGGRKVKAKVSGRRDIVKPPLELLPDSELPPDEEKVKETGMIGWSVIVARIISYPDGTEKEERRKVTYKPRPRRVAVHPCHIPKGRDGYTGERCPKVEGEEGAGGSAEGAGEEPNPG